MILEETTIVWYYFENCWSNFKYCDSRKGYNLFLFIHNMRAITLTLLTFFLVAQAMSGAYADLLLSLPDAILFDLAVKQKVGKCYITLCPSISCGVCDMYAKIKLSATTSSGLPDNYGSGCVVAPDYPKHWSTCFGPPNTYLNYNGTPTPICTSSGVKNAANMIRIGIKKGHCQIPPCWSHPWSKTSYLLLFFMKLLCRTKTSPTLPSNCWEIKLFPSKYIPFQQCYRLLDFSSSESKKDISN